MNLTSEATPIGDVITTLNKVADRRTNQRRPFVTVGTVTLLNDGGRTPSTPPYRIWTIDISQTGVLIKSTTEFAMSRVVLDLLIPELSDILIVGKMVREDVTIIERIDGKSQSFFLYGIEFEKTILKSSFQNNGEADEESNASSSDAE